MFQIYNTETISVINTDCIIELYFNNGSIYSLASYFIFVENGYRAWFMKITKLVPSSQNAPRYLLIIVRTYYLFCGNLLLFLL